ncbi:MAG: ATP synthase F1 subunit gamma [Anaerolineales bacterium]|nr:ATP synthase F1 subunit gamma [Anaerolineales bacterium]
MANAREMRIRIKSVKNIAQITRAMQAVSASNVRKAMQAMMHTRPYSQKAWQVLTHLSQQPGRASLHPLLSERTQVKKVIAIVITGDRGLAGAYNTNIVRYAMNYFENFSAEVLYVTVGRKGRDLLARRRKNIVAEFSHLPPAPNFTDVAPIGRIVVDDFLKEEVDEVYLVYTDFINMVKQNATIKKLLPLEIETTEQRVQDFEVIKEKIHATYIYEPGESEIIDEIVPRFTALQVYQAILESLASEHAARMVAMKNATDSAIELSAALQLEYNKARQQTITNEMLDIAGGAEALG